MSLHLENELSVMAQQLFTEELLDKLLNNNREKSLARDGGAYDWDYHGALEALSPILTTQQKDTLAKMETARRVSLQHLMVFSFHTGLYTGFQQYLSTAPLTGPYLGLVEHAVLEHAPSYPDYDTSRQQAKSLFEAVHDQLEGSAQDHWITLDLFWDDQEFGLALEAFHLGYRAALRSLRVSQGALSTADLLPKILLTEHDLGIVQTSQEKEWRKTIQARQRARTSPPRSPKA